MAGDFELRGPVGPNFGGADAACGGNTADQQLCEATMTRVPEGPFLEYPCAPNRDRLFQEGEDPSRSCPGGSPPLLPLFSDLYTRVRIQSAGSC